MRYSSVVRAFVGTNSSNAFDTVGVTMLEKKVGRWDSDKRRKRDTESSARKTIAAAWVKPAAAQSNGVSAVGKALGSGQGAIRQF